MKRSLLLLVTLSLLSPCGRAGARTGADFPPDERGILALDQALREIANPYTVMSIAAHPDDVDYGTLAYYRKRLGARTVIVFATRGEARETKTRGRIAQSAGEARTREALEAARIVGADVYFLNLVDFGYSKSAEDTFKVWGRDESLARLARAIRLLRPDVIISTHSPKTDDGHHQAVAQLTVDAFEAAADSKRFPEPGSEAWQVRRVFQIAEEIRADVTVNLAEQDYLRGLTYSQIGAAAIDRLSLPSPGLGEARAFYKLVRSATEERLQPGASMLDGLKLPDNLLRSIAPPRAGDLTLIEALTSGDRLIEPLKEKLIEKRAEGTPEELHARYGADFFRVIRFTEAIERALALALGLSLEVTASDNDGVPGQKLSARLSFRNSSNRVIPVVFHFPERLPVRDNRLSNQSEVIESAPGAVVTKVIDYELPKEIPPTLPHLFNEQYYALASALPEAQTREPFGHRLLAFAVADLGQATVMLAALTRFDVAPAVEIATAPFALLKDWDSPREIELPVRLRNRTPGALQGALWVVPLALEDDNYEPAHISFYREDEEVAIKVKLKLPILKPPLSPDILFEFRRERPEPPDPLGSAKVVVKKIEFEVAEAVRVGFISGADSWMSLALANLGVEHGEISAAEINASHSINSSEAAGRPRRACQYLSQFDTVIIDSRAYFDRPEISSYSQCLLEYVQGGGNLVVLAQRPDRWSYALGPKQGAPFEIRLSSNRITLETAPVKILDPDHPLMSRPNKITEKDFDGWVEERAAFLPVGWASEYAALVESADPGEEANRGGLLVARLGEGSYVYTSYAWRPQLLAMHAGAYRMLANLVSLPKVIKGQAGKQ